jgi:hypothetical protein
VEFTEFRRAMGFLMGLWVLVFLLLARSAAMPSKSEKSGGEKVESGWPPDYKNVQDILDHYKPENMSNFEFLAEIGFFDEFEKVERTKTWKRLR